MFTEGSDILNVVATALLKEPKLATSVSDDEQMDNDSDSDMEYYDSRDVMSDLEYEDDDDDDSDGDLPPIPSELFDVNLSNTGRISHVDYTRQASVRIRYSVI